MDIIGLSTYEAQKMDIIGLSTYEAKKSGRKANAIVICNGNASKAS